MPAAIAVAFDSVIERSGSGGRRGRRTSSIPNQFSPALYAIPDPSRISGSSPTSTSPSPYVVNTKRRDFPRPPQPVPLSADGGEEAKEKEEKEERFPEREAAGEEEEVSEEKKRSDLPVNGVVDVERVEEDDIDDFFNPKDTLSVFSSSDTEDGGGVPRRHVPMKNISVLTTSEFYDATDDFYSDSSASHASPLPANTETDLRFLRLNLFEEIEKRKKVEESLIHMQNQWKKMASKFSELGLSFPVIPDGLDVKHEDMEIAQVCQEIVVTRFVSEAIERDLAYAEVEEHAQITIDFKNHEISRLRDRLQYQEAVNYEMSQRNQEVIELARRKRQRRRRRQKLIWGCVGLTVTLGASMLAYSILPQHNEVGQSLDESNHHAESASAH